MRSFEKAPSIEINEEDKGHDKGLRLAKLIGERKDLLSVIEDRRRSAESSWGKKLFGALSGKHEPLSKEDWRLTKVAAEIKNLENEISHEIEMRLLYKKELKELTEKRESYLKSFTENSVYLANKNSDAIDYLRDIDRNINRLRVALGEEPFPEQNFEKGTVDHYLARGAERQKKIVLRQELEKLAAAQLPRITKIDQDIATSEELERLEKAA